MDYIERIDEQKEEMLQTLRELIAIPSVEEEAQGDMPFGKNVQEALEYMLARAKQDGFETKNVDNYGGHIDFGGKLADDEGNVTGPGSQVLGILGHLDVVPAGSGWAHDPFGGEIEDGNMYGRGTIDDKGPVVAVYYAMKAIKESGLMPQKKVRLILGLDEETGWVGMDHYFQKEPFPDLGFTPDADFPAIHGEMGILVFELAKKLRKSGKNDLVLRKMTGGNAPNMVPDSAAALLSAPSYDDIREKLDAFQRETGYHITARGKGKSLEITAIGKSAHGAQPWKGLNGISILMSFLERVGFANEDLCDFIRFYNEHLGFETDGESLGCGLSDQLSGKLILNVGTVEIDQEVARIAVNIRYPITMNEDLVYDAMAPVLRKYDLGIVKGKSQAPIYFEPDDPLITTLMDVYRKYTGDMESSPTVIGGGTYARAAKNIVAFGMLYPGEPETEHQSNEFVSVEQLIRSAKIYAEAICRLSDAKPIK